MYNQNLNNLLVFVAGAAVGSLATWYFTKNYYKKIADEEIESVKEAFGIRSYKHSQEPDEDANDYNDESQPILAKHTAEKPDIMAYAAKLQNTGYVDYSNTGKPTTDEVETEAEEEKEVDDIERPYVISPNDFDEIGYDTVTLTYYADGILTDEQDMPINDVDDLVGLESLDHFGEYEDDSVFVRNDALRTDFEILADPREYSDLYRAGPRRED